VALQIAAKAEPAQPIVMSAPRPRIVFMEVIRDESGEVTGLRPVYE
jgi:hypothetical protein